MRSLVRVLMLAQQCSLHRRCRHPHLHRHRQRHPFCNPVRPLHRNQVRHPLCNQVHPLHRNQVHPLHRNQVHRPRIRLLHPALMYPLHRVMLLHLLHRVMIQSLPHRKHLPKTVRLPMPTHPRARQHLLRRRPTLATKTIKTAKTTCWPSKSPLKAKRPSMCKAKQSTPHFRSNDCKMHPTNQSRRSTQGPP